MPGELWVFFLFNRKLLSKLSSIAAKIIQTFAKNKRKAFSQVYSLLAVSRYMMRPPIARSRLKHYDGNNVAFEYLDHKAKTYRKSTCAAEDFLEHLTQHIPDKDFPMIRYYHFLVNRFRANYSPFSMIR
ncbi:hypothetical protein CI610_00901 [invertebrate metagenome]|uniref:Transposase IS801/IS1294 domain-containing protein n=1 Tax=invertebrate metagenome TaxID=1711999 RepID=A0A2H9TA47_9ZZZZ